MALVELAGALVGPGVEELTTQLEQLSTTGFRFLALDMSRVTGIEARALWALIPPTSLLREAGGELAFVSPSAAVQQTLDATGQRAYFETYSSVDLALDTFVERVAATADLATADLAPAGAPPAPTPPPPTPVSGPPPVSPAAGLPRPPLPEPSPAAGLPRPDGLAEPPAGVLPGGKAYSPFVSDVSRPGLRSLAEFGKPSPPSDKATRPGAFTPPHLRPASQSGSRSDEINLFENSDEYNAYDLMQERTAHSRRFRRQILEGPSDGEDATP